MLPEHDACESGTPNTGYLNLKNLAFSASGCGESQSTLPKARAERSGCQQTLAHAQMTGIVLDHAGLFQVLDSCRLSHAQNELA